MSHSDPHLPSAGRLRHRLEAASKALLPGLAVVAGFIGLSLLAVWDVAPPAIHALIFMATLAVALGSLIRAGHVLMTHTPRRDLHWGWYMLVPPLLVVGVFAAGQDWERRLAVAVRPGLLFPPPSMTVAATVTPPAYTKVAPIPLTAAMAQAPLAVPTGSTLSIAVTDSRWPPFLAWGKESVLFRGEPGNFAIAGELKADGAVAVTFAGRDVARWTFTVEPDEAPTVAFAAPAAATPRGTIRVVVEASDDHGIQYMALKLRGNDNGQSYLVDLPAFGAQEIKASHYIDLRDQVLAGHSVTMELVAVDGLSQENVSPPITVKLPQFHFRNGLAQALAAARAALLKGDGEDITRAIRRLAALSESSAYAADTTVQLGVRTAYQRLRASDDQNTRQEMAQLLWDLALRAEDGNLSASENALHDALAQFIQTLRMNAPLAEQEDRLEAFTRRLEEYGRARTSRVMNSGRGGGRQTLREPVDWTALQRFLNRLHDLMVKGSQKEVLHLLTELEQGLEERPNLLLSAPAYRRFLVASYARKLLADVAREQRRLLSRAVASDIAGLPDEAADAAVPPALRKDQAALREIIVGIISQLDRAGLDDIDSVRRAKESMDDAVKSLEAGQGDGAAAAQVQVLTALDLASKALSLVPSPLSRDPEGRFYDPLGRPLPPANVSPGIDIEESLRRGGI